MKLNKLILFKFALIILFCHFIAASASALENDAWKNDKLCHVRTIESERTTIQGCLYSYCANISKTFRICACLPSIDSDEGSVFFEKERHKIKQWKATLYPSSDVSFLRVDALNLAGDKEDEFLVATMINESNGMGIQYWDVRAISNEIVSNSMEIEDYGVLGYPTQGDGNTCLVLSTRWFEGREPKLGDGLYLVGHWFELKENEFHSVYGRPVVWHRYTYSLEKKRLEAMSVENEQVLWFKDISSKPVIVPYATW